MLFKYFLISFCVFSLSNCSAQQLSMKANSFLESLTPDLRKQAFYEFKDEHRSTMNYIPMERPGPTFHDFNDQQKNAALDLLKASLSKQGFRKTTGIMELENILYKIENNTNENPTGKTYRDPLNYHFTVFGQPSETTYWGWKIEGHHVSFNFTSSRGNIISSTPSFLGSNPAVVPVTDAKGKEVLKEETRLGFELVNSLTPSQLKMARFSEMAPREIITGNSRKAKSPEQAGISYKSLNAGQQKLLKELIDEYLTNYEEGFQKSFREKIYLSGLDDISFSWAGGLSRGVGHYYRIQSPVLLIEYDNTQNNANHVHTVVRDLTNDFGEDMLKKHYEDDHKVK